MEIVASDISSLLFDSSKGSEFLKTLNNMLKALIDNDMGMVDTNVQSPQIWECKWLNNSTVRGYDKGYAVWINTNTPEQVIGTYRQHIISYVKGNSLLNQMYKSIDQNDYEAIDEFLLSVIEGTASKQVSPLYYLGDIHEPVQVRYSLKDNNKDVPSAEISGSWKDFYLSSTLEHNRKLLFDSALNSISSLMTQHNFDYHLSSQRVDLSPYVSKEGFTPDDVKTQDYFDHSYCQAMSGFDYVREMRIAKTGKSWCKIWNSGYVEQGGYVDNNKKDLIRVNFIAKYNYPVGAKFYQNGYDRYAKDDSSVTTTMSSSKHYVATVTPILKKEAEQPYQIGNVVIGNEIVKCCTDIAQMDNEGFCIVNIDTDANNYSKYCWHAAGYKIIHKEDALFDGSAADDDVDFEPPKDPAYYRALFEIEDDKIIAVVDGVNLPNLVEIPPETTSIGPAVFSGRNDVIKIDVAGNSLQTIEQKAFYECTSLKKFNGVEGGDCILSIYDSAFAKCTNLKDVSIGDEVKFIGPSAFYGDAQLTSVDRLNPKQNTNNTFNMVGDYAFSKTKLQSIDLVLSSTPLQTFWGDYCFADNSQLTSVRFLSSTYMSQGMFKNCDKLSKVEFTKNTTSYYTYPGVFENCTSLTSIVLPSKMQTLPEEMFKGCTHLKSVSFTNSSRETPELNIVQRCVFDGCNQLTSIVFPESISSLDQIVDACLSNCNASNLALTFKGMDQSSIYDNSAQKFANQILSSGMFRLCADCTVKTKDNREIEYHFNASDVRDYVPPIDYSANINRTENSNFSVASAYSGSSIGAWWYYNAQPLHEFAKERKIPCVFIYSLLGCGPCKVYEREIWNTLEFQEWTRKQNFLFCMIDGKKQPYFDQQLSYCANTLAPKAKNYESSTKQAELNALAQKFSAGTLAAPVMIMCDKDGNCWDYSYDDIQRQIDQYEAKYGNGISTVIECFKSLCLYHFDNNSETNAKYVVDAQPFNASTYIINNTPDDDIRFIDANIINMKNAISAILSASDYSGYSNRTINTNEDAMTFMKDLYDAGVHEHGESLDSSFVGGCIDVIQYAIPFLCVKDYVTTDKNVNPDMIWIVLQGITSEFDFNNVNTEQNIKIVNDYLQKWKFMFNDGTYHYFQCTELAVGINTCVGGGYSVYLKYTWTNELGE